MFSIFRSLLHQIILTSREFTVEITRTKYERGLFAELISLERASVPFGAVAQISQRGATFLRHMKNF